MNLSSLNFLGRNSEMSILFSQFPHDYKKETMKATRKNLWKK